ncbi:F-box/LRR-repeat protein 4-like [Temnothorax curvispinosus]|uniref:F-box/LRR-repeat protein 4-like n=1 Tax=Temnothorax curvispinosus TaxID=300111 RepID=A0A6J1PVJ0_9HYME|nr:F-box/LRR-repeat protein 4-like [Temnothorax curvispinosus]
MSSPSHFNYHMKNISFRSQPIGKQDDDHFLVEQFVKNVLSFSSQYGGSNSISYAAVNIIGSYSTFPEYGRDYRRTFAMRTYGPWWDKAPSRSIDYMPQNNTEVMSQDYINVEYHEAVYPIRVSIYETYNPGSVVRIWAQDPNNRWFLLWNGPPQIVPSTPRIFSPPLRSCDFKTKTLRLEFNHSLLDYYTELDAVLLIGTTDLILPKDRSHKRSITNLLKTINCKYPCHWDIHNLTPDYEDAHMDIVHLRETFDEHCIMPKHKMFCAKHVYAKTLCYISGKVLNLYKSKPQFKKGSNSIAFTHNRVSLNESKKSLHGTQSFSVLSHEIITKILRNLDLMSLCRMGRVNKYFNNLVQNPLLYKSLNLKPYWHIISTKALHYLAFKCKYLRRLDLSWCDSFSVSDLEKFLDTCGSLLTHLRLDCCSCIDDSAMLKISTVCKNLNELSLRNCDSIKDQGFLCLENLESLERLDLYRTRIKTQTLCKILRKNRRMRHLDIGGTYEYLNVDEVAMELRNSCPDLESIDLWQAHTLTSQGIDALADCKNLREVDFGWCDSRGSTTGYGDSFRRLLSSCEHLEKVFLVYFRQLTEHDLRALTLCKNLKQLDLLGLRSLTTEVCYAFFINCPKLEMIDLSFCNNITDHSIQQWQQMYPHVAIKKQPTQDMISLV